MGLLRRGVAVMEDRPVDAVIVSLGVPGGLIEFINLEGDIAGEADLRVLRRSETLLSEDCEVRSSLLG